MPKPPSPMSAPSDSSSCRITLTPGAVWRLPGAPPAALASAAAVIHADWAPSGWRASRPAVPAPCPADLSCVCLHDLLACNALQHEPQIMQLSAPRRPPVHSGAMPMHCHVTCMAQRLPSRRGQRTRAVVVQVQRAQNYCIQLKLGVAPAPGSRSASPASRGGRGAGTPGCGLSGFPAARPPAGAPRCGARRCPHVPVSTSYPASHPSGHAPAPPRSCAPSAAAAAAPGPRAASSPHGESPGPPTRAAPPPA